MWPFFLAGKWVDGGMVHNYISFTYFFKAQKNLFSINMHRKPKIGEKNKSAGFRNGFRDGFRNGFRNGFRKKTK